MHPQTAVALTPGYDQPLKHRTPAHPTSSTSGDTRESVSLHSTVSPRKSHEALLQERPQISPFSAPPLKPSSPSGTKAHGLPFPPASSPRLTELQPQGLCTAHSLFSQYPGDSFANFTQVYVKPSPPREALLEASLPCHPMPFISLLSIYLAPLDTPQLYLLLPPNQNINTTEAGFCLCRSP